MKKTLIVVALLVSVLVVAGVAGLAYAQTDTPPKPDYPDSHGEMFPGQHPGGHGPGMWGGKSFPGGFGGGMWGSRGSGEHVPMHEDIVNELAEALNVDPADIEARIKKGETMGQIAEEAGLSAEDFSSLMFEARQAALEQAVADGVISEEQADWMIQRFEEKQSGGFGPGSCFDTGDNAFHGPNSPRGRWHMDPNWDTQPAE